MINTIHISANVEKQLDVLGKSSKKGHLVVSQFHVILDTFLLGDLTTPSLYTKRTKHGEQRVKNCLKYDLGAGYRLITIKRNNMLFVLFIGSHDEVDLWLEKNKGYVPNSNKQNFKVLYKLRERSKAEEPQVAERVQLMDNCNEYDDLLMAKVDDNILKDIFCGLFAAPKS